MKGGMLHPVTFDAIKLMVDLLHPDSKVQLDEEATKNANYVIKNLIGLVKADVEDVWQDRSALVKLK